MMFTVNKKFKVINLLCNFAPEKYETLLKVATEGNLKNAGKKIKFKEAPPACLITFHAPFNLPIIMARTMLNLMSHN